MKCKLCAILAWYIWECIFCAPWRTRDNSAFWQVKTLSYWDCICLSHVRSFLFFLPWASWLQSLPSSQEYTLIYSHFNPWLHYVLLNIEFFLSSSVECEWGNWLHFFPSWFTNCPGNVPKIPSFPADLKRYLERVFCGQLCCFWVCILFY